MQDAAAYSGACWRHRGCMLCLGGAVCSSNCISLVLPTLLQSRSGEQSSPKQHDMLAALQAEERRQAEQGPPQQAALALRIERAKALRPCASLALPAPGCQPAAAWQAVHRLPHRALLLCRRPSA